LALRRQKHCTRPGALADDLEFARGCLSRIAIERQCFGNTHARGQQHFEQHPQTHAGEVVSRHNEQQPLDLFFGQKLHAPMRSPGQPQFRGIESLQLEHSAAELQEQLQNHQDAVLAGNAEVPVHHGPAKVQNIDCREALDLPLTEVRQDPRPEAVFDFDLSLRGVHPVHAGIGKERLGSLADLHRSGQSSERVETEKAGKVEYGSSWIPSRFSRLFAFLP